VLLFFPVARSKVVTAESPAVRACKAEEMGKVPMLRRRPFSNRLLVAGARFDSGRIHIQAPIQFAAPSSSWAPIVAR